MNANEHNEIVRDRLLSATYGEWNGLLTFNGLLLATATIAPDSSLFLVSRLFIMVVSTISAILVLLNLRCIRNVYQEIHDIDQKCQNPEKMKEYHIKVQNDFYMVIRKRMNKRDKTAFSLAIVCASVIILSVIIKELVKNLFW